MDARIAFVSTRDGSPYIYLATGDGSQVRRLTKGSLPAWSPDGRRIAFVTASAGVSEVRVIGADGSGEQLVAQQATTPSWSPDGTKILFVTPVLGRTDGGIFSVNVDGSDRRLVLSTEFANPGTGDWLGWPVWSPNGQAIAFVRANYDTGWQVYLMNADGSSPRRVAGADQDPSWSPDGMMIAAGSFQSIGIMNADGSAFQRLERAMAFDPDWSPDGRLLVFNSFSSLVGDDVSRLGSRMRIYTIDLETAAVRQLIPDAVQPAMPNYWDEHAVWRRD